MEKFKTEKIAAENPRSKEQLERKRLDRELLARLKDVFGRNAVLSQKLLYPNLDLSPEEKDKLMAEVGTLNDVSQDALKDVRKDYPEVRS
jgi:hypothetical protein